MAKTLIGTATTDVNGVATITYTATGIGDIIIQAESGDLLTETLQIEDCLINNVASSTDLSLFGSVMHWNGTRISSLSYDSSKEAYKLITGSGTNHSFIPINALTGSGDVKMEMDIMSGGSYSYPGFAIVYWSSTSTDSVNTGKSFHYRGITGYNGWLEGMGDGYNSYKSTPASVSANTWYHLVVELEGDECRYKLYNSTQTSLLASDTRNLFHSDDYTRYIGLICGWDGETTKWYKNIKVKPIQSSIDVNNTISP